MRRRLLVGGLIASTTSWAVAFRSTFILVVWLILLLTAGGLAEFCLQTARQARLLAHRRAVTVVDGPGPLFHVRNPRGLSIVAAALLPFTQGTAARPPSLP